MFVTVVNSSPVADLFQMLLSARYCQRALGAERPAKILPEESEAMQSMGDGRDDTSIFVHAAADPSEWKSDPFARAQRPEGDARSAVTATSPGWPLTGTQNGSTIGISGLLGSTPKSRMHAIPVRASKKRRQHK
jgi:hypothetical protein